MTWTRAYIERWRWLGLLTAGLALAACGGDTSPSSTALPDASSTPVEDVVAGAGSAVSSRSEPWLVERAAALGADVVHVRARTPRFDFPEIMSGGLAWLDVEGDGDMDLYVVQGGSLPGRPNAEEDPAADRSLPNRLLRNRGDGTFEDVTAGSGAGDTGYGMGVAVGDVDADGDVDLYVTNVGGDVLLRNRGDGTFEDATRSAGLGDQGWGTSAGFVDLDGDRDLDLWVVRYVHWSADREIECFTGAGLRDYCSPLKYNAPASDLVYRNDGSGRFELVTDAWGIDRTAGTGLGLAIGDFDQDGRVDVFVANDAMPNQLWMARGDGDGFEDRAVLSGAAVNMHGEAEAGMGVATLDLDDDGDLDLFMTHLREETNTLYRNHDGVFEDVTASLGLAVPGLPYTAFGTGFHDFDHDGNLDLYVAHGRVRDPLAAPAPGIDAYAEPNQLFRGTPQGFEEVLPRGGVQGGAIGTSRAAAFADLDGDGDVDVAVLENGGRLALYENRAPQLASAADRGWAMFRVREQNGVDAEGARLRLEAGGRSWWRPVKRVYSYQASHDPRVHVGVGTATAIDQVTVVWAEGVREVFGAYALGAVHEIRRGDGRPSGDE